MMQRHSSLATCFALPLLLLTVTAQAQEADTTDAAPSPPDTAATDTPTDTTQTVAEGDTLSAESDTLSADRAAVTDTATVDTLSAADRRARAEERAQSAATSWLSLTDAGQFGESWDAAAPTLQNSIAREAWIERGDRARSTLNDLQSRELTRALYRDSTTQLPTGSPVVALQYRTNFADSTALEAVITTKRDTAWKVAGYRVVPASRAIPDSVQVQSDSARVQPDSAQARPDSTDEQGQQP